MDWRENVMDMKGKDRIDLNSVFDTREFSVGQIGDAWLRDGWVELGWMCEMRGTVGLEKEGHEKALKWYAKAAGLGEGEDEEALWSRLEDDAVAGDAEAQFFMGCRSVSGKDEDRNEDLGLAWFMKSANQGYYRAQYRMGLIDLFGLYGERIEHGSAKDWLAKVVEQGVKHPWAMCELGRVKLLEAEREKKEGSAQEALALLKEAALQGNSEAAIAVALVYQEGACGIERDEEEAMKWLRREVDKGLRDAAYMLGRMYMKLDEYELAVMLFRKAAAAGCPKAQLGLMFAYENGMGVEKNQEAALLWCGRSAAAGHPEAQCRLGLQYVKGKGVEQSNAEAKRWLELSAEQGHPTGQVALAALYCMKIDGKRDLEQAFRWCQKALAQGEPTAPHVMAQIERFLEDEGIVGPDE